MASVWLFGASLEPKWNYDYRRPPPRRRSERAPLLTPLHPSLQGKDYCRTSERGFSHENVFQLEKEQ